MARPPFTLARSWQTNCHADRTGPATQCAGQPHQQIIHGKRGITGDTTLRLGHWFRTSPQFWLNLQAAYEIRAAETEVGGEIERLPRRPAVTHGDCRKLPCSSARV